MDDGVRQSTDGTGRGGTVSSVYVRRTWPNASETRLLALCLGGPRALSDGPVGQCTRRGWLRAVFEAAEGRSAKVRYELTELGRGFVTGGVPRSAEA